MWPIEYFCTDFLCLRDQDSTKRGIPQDVIYSQIYIYVTASIKGIQQNIPKPRLTYPLGLQSINFAPSDPPCCLYRRAGNIHGGYSGKPQGRKHFRTKPTPHSLVVLCTVSPPGTPDADSVAETTVQWGREPSVDSRAHPLTTVLAVIGSEGGWRRDHFRALWLTSAIRGPPCGNRAPPPFRHPLSTTTPLL